SPTNWCPSNWDPLRAKNTDSRGILRESMVMPETGCSPVDSGKSWPLTIAASLPRVRLSIYTIRFSILALILIVLHNAVKITCSPPGRFEVLESRPAEPAMDFGHFPALVGGAWHGAVVPPGRPRFRPARASGPAIFGAKDGIYFASWKIMPRL